MKVVSSCEKSGRICEFAQRELGERVMAVLYRNASPNGYKGTLRSELAVLFGMSDMIDNQDDEHYPESIDCSRCVYFNRYDCRPNWDDNGERCYQFKEAR